MVLTLFLVVLLLSSPLPYAYAAASAPSGKTVKLDYGSFQGVEDDSLIKFLGMPFAAPPVGNLRFVPPQPPVTFSGVHDATNYGLACPQQALGLPILSTLGIPEILHLGLLPSFHKCNKPASVQGNKKLPVLFWIYGGSCGFEVGDTAFNQGDSVVNRSIALGEPVIYVSANYRLNAFGFLGGKEALAAGAANVGLKDQRFAMKWVQKHIHNFGGDPSKVTIWGESAGAVSVALNLVINDGNTEGLFRAAVMESGSTMAIRSIFDHQSVYDQLVADTGCAGSKDTVACLRTVPADDLLAAVNNTPSLFSFESLILSYEPSIDGELIARSPMTSVQEGLYAKVPIINGDTDDEGTLFSFTNLNITTDAEFRDYISAVYLPGITNDQLDAITTAYPSDISKGSPFDTGSDNALTSKFKRIAAFEGDLIFHGPRRFLMQTAAKTQPTYGFLFKRDKDVPFLGSFHSSDLDEFYGLVPDFIAIDALINFVNTMDPNSPKHSNSLLSSIHWPLYGSSSKTPQLFTFSDPVPSVSITQDDFRVSEIQLVTEISRRLHPK
ncbi:Alpha/Beta hydrolase protein [Cyathus striatus]|nr:Alpha/Beta hydrolase protein [Cyathus striatus]